MLYVKYKDRELECATTLRVAYLIQGQHNHKPYTEIFENVGNMTVEQQIGIIYAAVKAKNKDLDIRLGDFVNEYLDTYDLGTLMEQIKEIISGIMGKEITLEAENAATEGDAEEENFQSIDPGIISLE
nr:MAG TPA: hypothetical protein [Caudoviricetes sp.]